MILDDPCRLFSPLFVTNYLMAFWCFGQLKKEHFWLTLHCCRRSCCCTDEILDVSLSLYSERNDRQTFDILRCKTLPWPLWGCRTLRRWMSRAQWPSPSLLGGNIGCSSWCSIHQADAVATCCSEFQWAKTTRWNMGKKGLDDSLSERGLQLVTHFHWVFLLDHPRDEYGGWWCNYFPTCSSSSSVLLFRSSSCLFWLLWI